MPIQQQTIDQIHSQLQIDEIISEYVTLKKKGTNLWGLCPFHHEKTPSFTVVPNLGFYKCFGCDAKGDAITFLIQHHNITYIEAIHLIAQKYNIPILQTTNKNQQQDPNNHLYQILTSAQNYYQQQLHQNPQNQHIKNYLTQRHITNPLIEKFQLGYSPNNPQQLYTHLTQKNYTTQHIKQAGLILQKTNQTHDLFRNRLIFPIHNLAGLIIGFAARRLSNDHPTPKYINSPETPIYKKSHTLYGLHQAKQTIKQKNHCYLVEGYTDVLALHRQGIQNVVASSGTSLTQQQTQLLSKFTKNITLLFDSDTAGTHATLRNINTLIAQNLNIKITTLPTGQDPDSYSLDKTPTTFLNNLQNLTQDFITYKIKTLNSQTTDQDPHTKRQNIQHTIETLATIPDPIQRTLYTQTASKLLNIPEQLINQEIQNHLQNTTQTQTPPKKQNTTQPQINPTENTLLYILLHYPHHLLNNQTCAQYLIQQLHQNLFTAPQYQKLFIQYKTQWQENNQLITKNFIQNLPENLKQTAINIMSNPYTLSQWQKYYQIQLPKENQDLEQWCLKNTQHLKLQYLNRQLKQLKEQLQKNPSQEQINQLLATYQQRKNEANQLARNLTIVIHQN